MIMNKNQLMFSSVLMMCQTFSIRCSTEESTGMMIKKRAINRQLRSVSFEAICIDDWYNTIDSNVRSISSAFFSLFFFSKSYWRSLELCLVSLQLIDVICKPTVSAVYFPKQNLSIRRLLLWYAKIHQRTEEPCIFLTIKHDHCQQKIYLHVELLFCSIGSFRCFLSWSSRKNLSVKETREKIRSTARFQFNACRFRRFSCSILFVSVSNVSVSNQIPSAV